MRNVSLESFHQPLNLTWIFLMSLLTSHGEINEAGNEYDSASEGCVAHAASFPENFTRQ